MCHHEALPSVFVRCPAGHTTCAECFLRLFDMSITRTTPELSSDELSAARFMVVCCSVDETCGRAFSFKATVDALSEKSVLEWDAACKRLYKELHFDEWYQERLEQSAEEARVESLRASFRRADGSYAAYQCPKCRFGPKELRACTDLRAHHGERVHNPRTGNVYQRNNACERCGFFAIHISQWHPWDGTVFSEVQAKPPALNQLRAIFPGLPEEELISTLQAHGHHLERTVDTLLRQPQRPLPPLPAF